MANFDLSANSSICLVIGDPISHSLSPLMHNAGYTAATLNFFMGSALVKKDCLAEAITGIRALQIKGVAITMPHKVSLLKLVDSLDPVAEKIGAINTIVNEQGTLKGFNTDWLGILRPLEKRTSLMGKKVAILGAGGAAQASLFACTSAGADVTIINRTISKAESIAQSFRASAKALTESLDLSEYQIIINATPLGMGDLCEQAPTVKDQIKSYHIIFETIYHPVKTKLVRMGLDKGCDVIQGLEMFLEQGLAQFELHTGTTAPREQMLAALYNKTCLANF